MSTDNVNAPVPLDFNLDFARCSIVYCVEFYKLLTLIEGGALDLSARRKTYIDDHDGD